MPISHLCLSCGTDLARVRARRDPHYGLPLVLCPTCGEAVVRRRHPIWSRWRSARRVGLAGVAMVVQLTAIAALTAAVATVCVAWTGAGPLPGTSRLVSLAVMVPIPLALGVWLTAGLSHRAQGRAWTAFAALAAFVLAADVLVVPMMVATINAVGFDADPIPARPLDWLARLGVLAVVLVVAAAGIPLGRVASRLQGVVARRWWRARRRRLRRAKVPA